MPEEMEEASTETQEEAAGIRSEPAEGTPKLGGVEKAAILLMNLGVEGAASIYKALEPRQMERLTFAIGRMQNVDPLARLSVLRECYQLMLAKQYYLQGGLDYARNVLGMAIGEEDAGRVLDRVQRLLEGNPFDFMEHASPQQLIELLRGEHPQTISLILAHLSPEQSSTVLQGLPNEIQLDVIMRIAEMENIAPQVLDLIHSSLKGRITRLLNTNATRVGGTKQVAELINRVDSSSENFILSGLSEQNPTLADEIKSLMFVFDDLVLLENRDLQKILGTADDATIVLALRATSAELKEKFLRCVSTNRATRIQEELEFMNPAPVREVQAAQQQIVQIAKDFEAKGEIRIQHRGEEEMLI